MAVINKFLSIEGRINALIEILPSITVNEEELSTEMQKLYKQLRVQPAKDDEEETPEQSEIDLK